MGSMSKALVDKFSIEFAYHAHDGWINKVVCTCRVRLILLDVLKVDVVYIFFANFFMEKL